MAPLRRNCEKTVAGRELTQEPQPRIYKLESDKAARGAGRWGPASDAAWGGVPRD